MAGQLEIGDGFAPESVYAEYTPEERAALDRMEEESSDRRAGILALRNANENHSVRGLGDESLRRLGKAYRRELEDIADGDLAESSTGHRARVANAKLADVEAEQEWRQALAETWQASEQGTHCYMAFQARGGLAAVIYHGATPPSYDLACKLDWEHFKRGLLHVLDWEATA